MAEQTYGGDLLNDEARFTKEDYLRSNLKKVILFLTLAAIAGGSVVFTLGFGVYNISLSDAVTAFVNHLEGNVIDIKDDHYVWDVRLPRAIGALVVGAGLSVGGAIMQNIFRNPLAEPYTMGISSGAFLGAVIAIVCGVSLIPIGWFDGAVGNAFICALIPSTIIVLISKFRKFTPTTMILTGVAIMYLFSSICQMLLVTAESESLADAYNWRVGTLSKMTWTSLPPMVVFTSVIIAILLLLSSKLDVLYAGDKAAKTMGVDAGRLRVLSLVLVSFMTATLVSFTGTIGFIGLVGPHIARIFVGSRNRYLIPASASFGSAFIILADTIAKVSGVNGLPVGVISAMIGGPLFIYILIRQRRSAWA